MNQENNLIGSAIIGVALAAVIGVAVFVILTSPGAVPRTGAEMAQASGSDPIYVEVESGDTAANIGKRLQEAQVIASADSFERLAAITGADARLVAGEYEFVPGTSSLDALVRIRDGLTAARIVTIPEGMRIEQVAELLEQRGIVSADDFLAAANSIATTGSNVDADLLQNRPPSTTLEGYIYPATYSFKRSVTADEAVLMMIQALSDRFTPELRQEARDQGLTLHEVLTLASIVEREVVLPEEMPLVASVYRNRLDIGMPLQADPTVQYALTQRPGSIVEFGWWKLALTLDDLTYDSSYNTYVREGMPPGPIANPGIAAIIAVIRPADTDYLFFVARNDGSHAFAETFEQHQANIQIYQP